jgi:hypothetical protein
MVPEKPAYFSRFAVKFAEILGAGIATAVSGYLVAHLGGYLSWPTKPPVPTVAIEAPAGGNARTPDRPRERATASAPDETHAAPDDRAKESARAAAKPVEVSTPATTAAGPADNDDKRSHGASRKPTADAHAVKPTPHETAEAKAQAQEAIEDQVRAALANVDASRTPTPNAPAPAATTPAPQTAAIPQPPPIPAPSNPVPSATTASTAATAAPPLAVPPAGPVAPPLDIQNGAPVAATTPGTPVAVSASAQQTPAEPGPLTAVEIKSRPVAGIGETSPGAQATAEATNDPDGKAKGETDKGFFSTIAHLPEMLRTNAHAPVSDPPRPPMPVGE